MEVQFESKNVFFYYEPDYRLCVVKWKGKVPTDEFKAVIRRGIELVRDYDGMTNIILDRYELEEFSDESRRWLKEDFMKNEGKVLIKKVNKLAAIKPKTIYARVITKLLSIVFQVAHPGLKYKVFDKQEEGFSWVKEAHLVESL